MTIVILGTLTVTPFRCKRGDAKERDVKVVIYVMVHRFTMLKAR